MSGLGFTPEGIKESGGRGKAGNHQSVDNSSIGHLVREDLSLEAS